MIAQKLRKNRRNILIRNVFCGLISIVVAPLLYNAIGAFITSDPFVGLMNKTTSPLADSIGIRMNSVELRDFNGDKLVSSAFAKRVDVRKDRQVAMLYGVKNGFYNGDQGPIHYSAARAIWNFQTKIVIVNGNVAVQNKDLDVKAKGLTFDDRSSLLRVQGDVTGRLYKGQVLASALTYNMKTGGIEAGPIDWKGELALSPQDDNKVVPKKWDIKGDHFKSLGSHSDTMVYDNAVAQDEDLIIAAPLVQHNKKTDVLTASGGISYYSGKADIKADRCTVYRKEKRVVLDGHVFMYVKSKSHEDDPPKVEPLPDFKPVTPDQVIATHTTTPLDKDQLKEQEDEIRSSKNLRDFPLVVVSQKTEYWYGKGNRHAVITGEPQARQGLKEGEWRHVWSHYALYDGEKETLKLLSSEKKHDALMKNSLGDETTALDILVSTNEDDDFTEGHEAIAKIYSAEDDDVKSDKKKVAPPPAAGTSKTGGTGSGS